MLIVVIGHSRCTGGWRLTLVLRTCPTTVRYNVNSVESHVAIEIVSKVVRLMATDDEVEKIAAEGLLSVNGDDGGVSNFAGS